MRLLLKVEPEATTLARIETPYCIHAPTLNWDEPGVPYIQSTKSARKFWAGNARFIPVDIEFVKTPDE